MEAAVLKERKSDLLVVYTDLYTFVRFSESPNRNPQKKCQTLTLGAILRLYLQTTPTVRNREQGKSHMSTVVAYIQ